MGFAIAKTVRRASVTTIPVHAPVAIAQTASVIMAFLAARNESNWRKSGSRNQRYLPTRPTTMITLRPVYFFFFRAHIFLCIFWRGTDTLDGTAMRWTLIQNLPGSPQSSDLSPFLSVTLTIVTVLTFSFYRNVTFLEVLCGFSRKCNSCLTRKNDPPASLVSQLAPFAL